MAEEERVTLRQATRVLLDLAQVAARRGDAKHARMFDQIAVMLSNLDARCVRLTKATKVRGDVIAKLGERDPERNSCWIHKGTFLVLAVDDEGVLAWRCPVCFPPKEE